MIFWLETIIEALSVPLQNWDRLRVRYKIIFSVLVIISMVGIVILINQ